MMNVLRRVSGRVAVQARSGRCLGPIGAFGVRSGVRRSLLVESRGFCTQKVSGDDSHSDFAPQSKVDPTAEVQDFLDEAVKSHDVLLFMKGTPQAPRCGYSAQVCRVLSNEGVDFSHADVLSSDEIREGIKKYSDWPTIPQLYVGGEFVGGCNIVVDMHTSGELATLLAPMKEKKDNKEE